LVLYSFDQDDAVAESTKAMHENMINGMVQGQPQCNMVQNACIR